MDNCFKCGGIVHISPQYGGRGTGELTQYYVECKKCDMFIGLLGKNTGRKAVAIREYNNYAIAQKGLEDKDG